MKTRSREARNRIFHGIQVVPCMFNVLHLKSTNIGSSSFYEEKNLNRIKQNAFKKWLSFDVNGVYV